MLAAYREFMVDPRPLACRRRRRRERLLDFFLLEKASYEIEYELAHRPDWLRVPLVGMLRILARRSARRHDPLPPEAYAIVAGRHSDPFHYLGLHVEEDGPVVRVFLPDADDVAVIDAQGHESGLHRIHGRRPVRRADAQWRAAAITCVRGLANR